MNSIFDALMNFGKKSPAEGAASPTVAGMNMNELSAILGQVAGAVAPGTTGARVGQAAASMAQGNIMAEKQAADKDQLNQILDGLTGQGVKTTGVQIGKNGEVKVTGTKLGTVPELSNDGQGGQNATTSPFDQGLFLGE